MTPPRITLITPNHNQVSFLERSICSALDQEYENLELIVIDGGSTDDSLELIRFYDDELAFWASGPNSGQSDAINRGLSRATGDIVAVLNSDDLLLPGSLEEVAKVMGPENAPQWLVGRCLRMGEHDELLGALDPHAPRSTASFLMHDSGVLPAPSTFFRRLLFEDHGLLDPDLRFAFFYEFSCRLLIAGLRPAILGLNLAARREFRTPKSPARMFQNGLELVDAAERHAGPLPAPRRRALLDNCDRRRRIHALAQAELAGDGARRFLLNELVSHPSWIADDAIRRTVVHGVVRPAA